MVVALLAGVSCLVTLPALGLPVWALFIGWAWYFALGATPDVLKKIYPSMIPGALLALLCIFMIDFAAGFLPPMIALIIPVIITVYLLMLSLKIPSMSTSLVAFNSYSCVFAVFYGAAYRSTGSFGTDVLMAMIFSLIATGLGPLFGYFSIFFTFPEKEKS
ncbi:MAG: DUF1097 domain-containing protein [Bacillota bacterium]|nr:DUF1097 domain-containing protein [Bacillota bacterium]